MKATYTLAAQMLIFIGSFIDYIKVKTKMCIFVALCVDETLFYMREYSDAIKLPKS